MHFKFLVVTLFAAGCVTEAEPTEAEPEAETTRIAPREELARIALAQGEVTYYELTDTGEVAMLARSIPGADGQMTVLDRDLTPLDAYLALTTSDTPIPRALAATDPTRVPAGRALADKLVVTTARDQARSGTTSQATAAQMCNEGGSSESFFAQICPMFATWDVSFCHNGTWHSVTDEWDNVGASRSITLACGANGRVRHYYKAGGLWYETVDEPIPAGEMWQWTYVGVSDLRRKITHSRTAPGFVRGASWFL
ncbi:MAG: hypothetical protein WKG01_34310 [Kofleriaceae bacterium]